jgi:hypothetical protein
MSDRAATKIPAEARAGLMRAWLEILKERHPEVTWVAQDTPPEEETAVEHVSLFEDLVEMTAI